MGTVTRLFDGLANALTGRGTTVDRGAMNFWVRRFTTPQQVEAAYLSSWLHRKIIDKPAKDMTRAGRDWDAKKLQIALIEAEEKRLGLWGKLRDGIRLGRLGGGAILIGLGDDPSTPLPKVQKGGVKYLTVLSRWQLTLGDVVTDPADPLFNQPQYFALAGSNRSVRIHPSRLVCFHGLPVPAIHSATWEDRFWGMSMVEVVDEPVQQATTAASSFASLIDEAKVDVFRFFGLAEKAAQGDEGEATIMKRVALTTQAKSIHRAVILDKDDEWEQRQLTLTGFRDTIITFDGRVAGAASMPATELFGKSPDGMNATGEGDKQSYHQQIGSDQEDDLRPPLEQIDAALLPSAGVPSDLTWKFSPLTVLSDKDEAEIENKEADTLSKLEATGLFSSVALEESFSNRLVESQRWPGYGEAREKQKASGDFDPSDETDPSEIVPIPAKGGDPASIGAGGASVPPRRARAANDKKASKE